jgi:putative chitinase
MILTLETLIACGASQAHAGRYVEPLNHFLPETGIDTPLRVAHFLAQVLHESQRFARVTENLNYSADALLKTWPKRFTAAEAVQYARDPEGIANKAYARAELGNVHPGDGWKYRGRGLIQVTGKANYRALSLAVGIDYVQNPDWLVRPVDAVRSACWFWNSRNLSGLADVDQVEAITRKINGGLHGLEERKALLIRTKKILIPAL